MIINESLFVYHHYSLCSFTLIPNCKVFMANNHDCSIAVKNTVLFLNTYLRHATLKIHTFLFNSYDYYSYYC